ncbi:MAG: tetratricopeptide repeat protein [Phycisphaerales bacterium]
MKNISITINTAVLSAIVLGTAMATATLLPAATALAGPTWLSRSVHIAAEPPTMEEALELVDAEEWEEAKAAFAAIHEAEPENEMAFFMLSYTTHANGDLEEAIKLHKEVAKLERFRPVALYNTGCAYALLGKKDQAFEALAAAKEAGFDNPNQIEIDSDLDSLRDDPRFEALFGDGDNAPADAGAATAINLASLQAPRQLDFMVGTWKLMIEDHEIGNDETVSILDGHVVEQHGQIRNEAGEVLKYKCLFAHDTESNTWHATWVSNQGHYDLLTGKLSDDGTMVFSQPIVKGRAGEQGRMTLRNVTSNGYQLLWQLSPDGNQWETQATIDFVRSGR